jgi:Ser/Thr protein kinase RdoA (MazF antagonist)
MKSTSTNPREAHQSAFLDRFDLGFIKSERVLEGGMFSQPLLLECERGDFVLREHTFRADEASFCFQAEAIAAAANQGISCARVVKSVDGRWCIASLEKGSVFALHEYAEGKIYDWHSWQERKDSDPSFVRQLGTNIALLHNALASANPGGSACLSSHLPPIQFNYLDVIYEKWLGSMDRLRHSEILSQSGAKAQLLAHDKIIDSNWRRLRDSLSRFDVRSVPTQIVHGDISPVNLVFGQDGRISFIDWDCVHVGHRVYDALGDILHRPPVERPDLNQFRRDHLETFISAYSAELDKPLSLQEQDLIPALSLARQLEDLRQRMQVVHSLDQESDIQYGKLIQLRVEIMEQISLN